VNEAEIRPPIVVGSFLEIEMVTTGAMLTGTQIQTMMQRHSTAIHYAILDYRASKEILAEYADAALWELRRVEQGYPATDDPAWTAAMQTDCDSFVSQLRAWQGQMDALYNAYTGENSGANYAYEIAKRVSTR